MSQGQSLEIERRVLDAVGAHPATRAVRLVGSRAEGRATALSDWDFRVETEDFAALAASLPSLFAPLEPVAAQWDRLSPHRCWMAILPGGVKVDLIFADEPHDLEPPWVATPETLAGIDAHFWDWLLWLASKDAAGKHDVVAVELDKLFEHLLAPLGATERPASLAEAIATYRAARDDAETRFGVRVPRRLEDEAAHSLRSHRHGSAPS